MAHDLVLGKTSRDWSLNSQGKKLPKNASSGSILEPNLLFNKWTAALLVGGIAVSALLATAIRR
jgi:hypothetical protein